MPSTLPAGMPNKQNICVVCIITKAEGGRAMEVLTAETAYFCLYTSYYH